MMSLYTVQDPERNMKALLDGRSNSRMEQMYGPNSGRSHSDLLKEQIGNPIKYDLRMNLI